VLKSGSPTLNDTTLSPAAFIAFALAEIARVSDGEMDNILPAILFFIKFLRGIYFLLSYFTVFFKENQV
jgi:hypothetical protein